MANILGQLVVNLIASTAGFESGMNAASKLAQKSSKEIQGAFNDVGDALGSLLGPLGSIGSGISSAFAGIGKTAGGVLEVLGPLGGAAGVAGVALAGMAAVGVAVGAAGIGIAIHAADAAAHLGELSQSTGVSVESLSLLGDVAEAKGISVDSMGKALEKLSKSAVAAAQAGPKASNAYKDLGIAVTNADGTMRPAEDIFNSVSAKFATMPDGPLKTAEAIKLFGKSGAELIPLLNEGGEKLTELEGHYKSLGDVITGPMAQSSEQLKENESLVGAAFTGVANDLLADLVPAINVVAQEFVSFFEDNRTQISTFAEGVGNSSKVVLNLAQVVGEVLSLISRVVTTSVEVTQTAIQTASNVTAALGKGDISGAWDAVKAGGKTAADSVKYNFDQAVSGVKDSIKSIAGVWTAALPSATAPKPQTQQVASAPIDLDFITKTVDALQRQAEKEETLAGAIGKATQSQIDANAAAIANEAIEKLVDEATQKKIQNTTAFKNALAAAIPQIQAAAQWQATFKAAIADQGEFDSFTKKIKDQIAAMEGEADAGNAVEKQQAKNTASLKPLADVVAQLTADYKALSAEYGDQDSRVKDLAQKIASLNQQYAQEKLAVDTLNAATAANAGKEELTQENSKIAAIKQTTAALLAGGEAYAKVSTQVAEYAAKTGASDDKVKQFAADLKAENVALQQQAAIALASPGQSQQAQNLQIQIATLQQLSDQWQEQGKDITGVQQAMLKLNAEYQNMQVEAGGAMAGMTAAFADFAAKVPTMGQTMQQLTTTALNGIGDNLATMIATGKAKWSDLVNSMETALLKSSINTLLKQMFSSLGGALSGQSGVLGSLGSMLKGGAGGASQAASSAALTTAATTLSASGATLTASGATLTASGATLTASAASLTAAAASLAASAASSSVGSVGGGLGAMAEGGDVTPGRSYIVGEKRAEIFTPRTAGTITPNPAMAGGQSITQNYNISTPNADSFQRSQKQISSQMYRDAAYAHGQMRR